LISGEHYNAMDGQAVINDFIVLAKVGKKEKRKRSSSKV